MRKFIQKYLDPKKQLKILEVGSLDVHNPRKRLVFRRYFEENSNWEFTGLDIVAGRNVDIVSRKPYKYPFPGNHFDIVISGNTLEHVEDLHRVIKEIARITKDLVWISVPNTHHNHRYPIDCWRIFPDGMQFLLEKIAKLKVLECRMSGKVNQQFDTIGIAKKEL